MTDDAGLLHEYVESANADAFAELVRRHVDAVYSAALRRVGGDCHLAEDVVQQVFIALARHAASLRRHPCLAGWLHRATRNHAANAVRSERRRKTRESLADLMNSPDDLDWRRVGPVLDAVIDDLREIDRSVVVWRFFEQRTHAQIGAALGVGEDAARHRIERALERLRKGLERRGARSSVGALALGLSGHAVGAAPVGLAAQVSTTATAALVPPVAGSIAALISVMSTSKGVLGVGGVLLLALISTGLLPAVRDARHADSDLAAARTQQEELGREVQALTAELADAARAVADVERELDERLVAARDTAPQIASPVDAFLARLPEVHDALLAHADARTYFRYGGFLRQVSLTPAQREAFMALMREGTSVNFEPGSDWVLQAAPGVTANRNGKLREMLGPKNFDAFRQYRDGTTAREDTAVLAGALAFTDAPLTSEQVPALVKLFDERRNAARNGAPADVARARFLERGRRLLGPAQHEWLAVTYDYAMAKEARNALPPTTAANTNTQR